MREVKLSATREEVARLRELFGEFYDEENKVKRVHKAPDKDYPTVEKYVDHLYEIGMPRGTSVKNMGIILENNYETLSKAPEYSEGTTTMTGAPEYGAPSNTLTPDQLKQFQEDLEVKEEKRKAAVQHAETNVDAGIKKQQEIYAKQLEQIKAKAKEFEEQTKFAKIKEAKLAEDQQKEIDDLTQNAKADPIKTVEKLSDEIEKRSGGSVPKEAADVAAFEVVSSLSLNYVPVIQTSVAEAVSKEAASKGEKEVAEWIAYLSGENQGIDLSKEIITKTFGQEFTNATLPEVEVSNNPGVGLGPVSLAFIPKEAEENINEKSKILDEPFLHEADYANKWFGSQLALMQGDRSVTQRELYFSAFKPQGKVDWQGIGGQNRLNIISGASEPLKIAGGLAKGAVTKAVTKGAVSKITAAIGTTAGGPAGTAIGIAIGELASRVLDSKFFQNAMKWSLAAIGALTFAVGLAFGIPGVMVLGTGVGGYGVARAMGITAAQVGNGTVRLLGALAGATLGAIGLPILVTLIGFPVVVALILFIINSGAYVVPPSLSTLANQNQFIGVEKTANPTGPFSNGGLPASITYAVKITAKKKALTITSLKNECVVITSSGQQNCPAPDIAHSNSVGAGSSSTYTYDVSYSKAYKDALILDTVTVTATVEGEKEPQTAEGSYSIVVGNPPTGCFAFDKSWNSQASGKANVSKAISKMLVAKTYMATLCQGNKTIALTYSSKPVSYGGEIIGGGITLYHNGVYLNDLVTLYTLAHESGHIYAIRTNVDEKFGDDASVAREGFLCTYPMRSSTSEDFAETIALFISKHAGSTKASCLGNFKTQYTNHWLFAKNNIFFENLGW